MLWQVERAHETGVKIVRWIWSNVDVTSSHGELPSAGSEVEEDGQKQRVTKVAPSPLPGDPRLCAYLQAV